MLIFSLQGLIQLTLTAQEVFWDFKWRHLIWSPFLRMTFNPFFVTDTAEGSNTRITKRTIMHEFI